MYGIICFRKILVSKGLRFSNYLNECPINTNPRPITRHPVCFRFTLLNSVKLEAMKTLFALLSLILISQPIVAQSTGRAGTGKAWLLSKSSEAKAAKRFSLQEWLENKDRRGMMDMWLAINTPSPYEFMFGGSFLQYDKISTTNNVGVTQRYKSYDGEVHAYATLVGITALYQNNNEEGFSDVTGQFNLRLFGTSTQSSNIILHYGLRTRTAHNDSYRLNQLYPGITLQIYLMKLFGIYGNYHAYSPITESFYGDTSADELNAGIFIEYGLLRIFGNYYNDRQNSKLNGIETQLDRKGTKVGLQFHF
jgi:hypothetical protein